MTLYYIHIYKEISQNIMSYLFFFAFIIISILFLSFSIFSKPPTSVFFSLSFPLCSLLILLSVFFSCFSSYPAFEFLFFSTSLASHSFFFCLHFFLFCFSLSFSFLFLLTLIPLHPFLFLSVFIWFFVYHWYSGFLPPTPLHSLLNDLVAM